MQLRSFSILIATVLLLITGIPATVFPQSSAPKSDPRQPSQTPASQDDVLRVETDLVLTLFTALDRDRRFVNTLRQEDLRILEDGVEQPIGLFERETDRPLTLVVLVDTSRSQERTLPQEKTAAKKFVEAVIRAEKDYVAVVSFTGAPKIELTLSNTIPDIKAAIERVSVQLPDDGCEGSVPVTEDPRCWTSIWDSVIASTKALANSKRGGARRAIVLLTDGDDTSSRSDYDEAITTAISNDVAVYAIGIGDPEKYSIKKSGVTHLAEKSGGRAFFPKQESELDTAFAQIQDELRSQYVIGYSPQNKTRDGAYRKLKIEIVNKELKKKKLRLLHRQGYYATQH